MINTILAKFKRGSDSEPARASALGIPAGGVTRMVSSSGRIGLPVLQQVARSLSREDFVRFMQQPVLAGAAIHLGTLAAGSSSGSRTLNRTILFEPLEGSTDPGCASDSLKQAIYPLVRSEFATSAGSVFSIRADEPTPALTLARRHLARDPTPARIRWR